MMAYATGSPSRTSEYHGTRGEDRVMIRIVWIQNFLRNQLHKGRISPLW